MAELHVFRSSHAIGLESALADASNLLGGGALCLLYAPRELRIGCLDAGSWRDAEGRALALGGAYEARAFSERCELRWLSGEGAVALTEESAAVTPSGWAAAEGMSASETIGQTYLLWGRATGDRTAAGWWKLRAARIGAQAVPLPDGVSLGRGDHVQLQAVEYVCVELDGNAAVVEERLAGLRRLEVETMQELRGRVSS